MKKNTLKLLTKCKTANLLLWNRIQQINMKLIRDRMIIKYGWMDERTDDAIQLYLIYMYITQVYNQPVSPSEDVDEIWHTHILHTNKYEMDCHFALGKFLHHFPTPSTWSKDASIKNKTSFCCDNADCCNDNPRSTPISKGRIGKKSNCSGTTNCGNEPPSDCASFIPNHGTGFPEFGLIVDSSGALTSNCNTIHKGESDTLAQSLHGRLDGVNYDNPQKTKLGEVTFFKDLISDFFEFQ